MPRLNCGCCGIRILDHPSENASFHLHGKSYPHDRGYGLCLSCGGDRNSEDFEKRAGSIKIHEYRIAVHRFRECLSPKNQKRFDEMDFELQCAVVNKAVIDGVFC